MNPLDLTFSTHLTGFTKGLRKIVAEIFELAMKSSYLTTVESLTFKVWMYFYDPVV